MFGNFTGIDLSSLNSIQPENLNLHFVLGIILLCIATMFSVFANWKKLRLVKPISHLFTRVAKQSLALGILLLMISFGEIQEIQILQSRVFFVLWLIGFIIVITYDSWYTLFQLPDNVARYKSQSIKDKFLPKRRKQK